MLRNHESGPQTPADLLVSVRSRSELSTVIQAEVDIVDLKEPHRGALSPSSVELWQHAAEMFRGPQTPTRPRLSAALGEQEDALDIACDLPNEFAFAKVGPSGCESTKQIMNLWQNVRQSLAEPIELVAVAYADPKNACCLDPESIMRLACNAGFRCCLIDTFGKDGRSTLDHLGIEGIARLGRMARESGLWWAMAGSIQSNCLSTLSRANVYPDCFGVRGDVCDGGREGTLNPSKIKAWNQALLVSKDGNKTSRRIETEVS